MKRNKSNLLLFFEWMRNGTAFCTTWFLILILIYSCVWEIPTISTRFLIKMILFSVGAVFLFTLFFTQTMIKKWSFIKRLTGFMISICVYQCVSFYFFDFFQDKGTIKEWLVFIGIILASYFCCIFIYQQYSRRQGEIYTKSLQAYQEKRSMEHGK